MPDPLRDFPTSRFAIAAYCDGGDSADLTLAPLPLPIPVDELRTRLLRIRLSVAAECRRVRMFPRLAGKHHSARAAVKPVDRTQVPEMTIGDSLQGSAGWALDGSWFRQGAPQ